MSLQIDLKLQDIHVSILSLDHVNSRRAPKHNDRMFDVDIGDMMHTEEQQHVIDNIVQNPQGLHILTGTPGSCKTLFVK